MSKKSIALLIILVLLLPGIPVHADDAVLGGNGKTVFPVKSGDIRMVFEKIDMRADFERTFVTCEFVFENQGEAAEIEMGFPEDIKAREGWPDKTGIYGFKAWAEGTPCEVIKKKGSKPVENELGKLEYPYWHTFKVKFEKGQTVTVKNTYWAYNGYDSTGAWIINYILKTGSVWKGTIGKIDINMTIVGYMPYFGFFMPRAEECYEPVSVSPYGVIKWHMENVEPEKDISICYKPNFDRDIRNVSPAAQKFWKRFFAMDYKNALRYIPEAEETLDNPNDISFKDNVNLAIGATYYYNKNYVKASEYFDKYGEANSAAMYYKALIYQKKGDFKAMKCCLDKLRESTQTGFNDIDTMEKWVEWKYKTYGKYF